ncbi:MAG: succinate dehydrogenase, hydrophobic membrane anchor protein [Rhodospirillaceae bacterium]|nr:succinate dehydrogenase, hydrophobic membrane anchor protein [Rhodospirillaceae bacterium]
MNFRSPLGRVRGLGSAKDGTAHWWAQRVTAVALVPLGIWFVINLLMLVGEGRGPVLEWFRSPVSATLTVLMIGAVYHHAQLGLQVVIEDYVHNEGAKIALILAVKFAALILAGIGIISVLRIAFGA